MEEDRELIETIQSLLGDRALARCDSELSKRLLAKFPFSCGRVNWEQVPGYVYLGPPSGAFEWDEYVVNVVSFLERCLHSVGRSDAWVAYLGDNTEVDYEVERSALPSLLRLVTSIPEHKYVFALDASWCLMWTMACQLYFGSAPDLSKRRRKSGG